MKVLNLEQFLGRPAGTIFCKYEPCCVECLEIKAENINENDFVAMSIDGFSSNDSSGGGVGDEFEYRDDYYGRDGLYEEDQLFLVYSKKEIEKMVNVLLGK